MGFERFGWVSYASQTRISKFVDYLQEGKIYGTKCKECGCVQFPPRAHCVRCLSSSFEWKELAGDCVLITYTKVEAAPSMFKEQAPYLLGLAELPEGPKVFAWIDKTVPEDRINIGMKLKLNPTKLANGNLCYALTLPNATSLDKRQV
ncbi:MAG: Zn-ribbon domain-containing OB-fold protein [Candidatus Bathyarchaeia archaeon]